MKTLSAVLFLICCLNSGNQIFAQQTNLTLEKKVDYLERVYFSGENKEGLNTQILIALQELQEKKLTASLTKQFAFLQEIQKQAPNATDACDMLDMLAVGIYNIDAAEALKEGVKPPSDKAKMKSLSALARINSASKDINKSAKDLQWTTNSTNGVNNSISTGAGQVANTAQTIGNVANAAQQAEQTAKDLSEVGKSLGINAKKKDKPCPEVPKKTIKIGDHQVAGAVVAANPASTANTTTISITGISSSTLRELTESLRSKAGVTSAEKSFNEESSTISVIHEGKTDALADWIEDKFGSQLKVVNYSNGKISLASKAKK